MTNNCNMNIMSKIFIPLRISTLWYLRYITENISTLYSINNYFIEYEYVYNAVTYFRQANYLQANCALNLRKTVELWSFCSLLEYLILRKN